MKKLVIILGIIIGIVVLAAFIVPVIFKDDIRAAIDKALAESVNADFVFDTEDFSVSMFDHFPNPSARLNNFGIINREPFEGEVFFAVEELEAVIDLGSVIFGDQIKIKGIVLENPRAFLKVLEDGRANWDIAIDTEAPTETNQDTAAVNYNLGIENWQINNGEVTYEDLSLPFKLSLSGLKHSGSGDFTQDIIDIQTSSAADSISVMFDGVEYISDKTAEIDLAMRISDDYSKYEFGENQVRINDFAFGFVGGFTMLPDGFGLDLTFSSSNNSFKSLLSLIPGMYHDDFERIQASGQLSFEGMVKGKYDSLQYPAFDITMNVKDAGFKYPDVEESFSDIQMDLTLQNETNNIDNTRIALNNFHLLMGDKPFDGKFIVENLKNFPLNAALKGSIDLGDVSRIMPVEGLDLRGLLNIDIAANGIYDSIQKVMPKLDGTISLSEGYIKSADFPATLDNFNVNAILINTSGSFEDFLMNLSQFSFNMDGEPFEGKMTVSNLDNITWDLLAKGTVDLEKLSKIFSLQDMELAGNLAANLSTKGNMAALEAEKYAQLPTSGTVSLTNFRYADTSLPYDVTLSEANASFNPQRMEISKMDGTIGQSDFSVDGYVSNYIGYVLSDDQILKGNFNFRSNNLDLNEFMSDEETPTVEENEESMGVIEIPQNIDMTLSSNLKKVKMMDMEMSNVVGQIIARDGVARMENVNFNLLEGQFIVNGSYSAKDITKPTYDFDLNINDLSIRKAFEQFEVVKNFAPIAEKITGKFSTDFKLNGLLTQKMSPDLATVNGAGLVKILQATLKDSKIVKGLTSITKLSDTDEVALNDIKLNASIENGRLVVEPFDLKLLGYEAVVSGNSGIDGSIDFLTKIQVPGGQLAQSLNQFIGGTGEETVILPVAISGTYSDPEFGLETSEMKEEVKEAAKEKAKEEVKELATDAIDKALKDDKVKDIVGGILGGKKDSTQQADTVKEEKPIEKVEEAKETIKNLFNRKKKGD